MKLETIMKMEDSRRKFHLLELNLIKLQWHGKIWEAVNREYNRLFHIYRGTDWIKPGDKVKIKTEDGPASNGHTPAWCNQWIGTVVRVNKKTVTVEFEVDEPGRKTLRRYVDYQDIQVIPE